MSTVDRTAVQWLHKMRDDLKIANAAAESTRNLYQQRELTDAYNDPAYRFWVSEVGRIAGAIGAYLAASEAIERAQAEEGLRARAGAAHSAKYGAVPEPRGARADG